ncbi:hypothetical protein BREVUG8_110341 [Brevundimonas sp. G8]|nr:hypothetical protein BREVUG8_110341 [Brevundimonas sp. G8]
MFLAGSCEAGERLRTTLLSRPRRR